MKLRSALRFGAHFARCYQAALPRIAWRTSLSVLLDPKGSQKFLHEVLTNVDLGTDDPVLGSRTVTELMETHYPGGRSAQDVLLVGRFQTARDAETRVLAELAALAWMARVIQPARVFEIGTFVGRVTRLFAANAPDTEVLTLDLPPGQVKHDVGVEYRGTPEASRIRQLSGDSTAFDYSPWHGQCDFVWVDACHDYDFAVSDTRAAFRLCRPGGWIGWHDYHHSAAWAGVTRCVRELRPRYPSLTHLRGTTMAVLRVPEG